jgi:hypothetical protein
MRSATVQHSHHPKFLSLSLSLPSRPFSSSGTNRNMHVIAQEVRASYLVFFFLPWFSRRSGALPPRCMECSEYKTPSEPSVTPLSVLSGPMAAVSRILGEVTILIHLIG